LLEAWRLALGAQLLEKLLTAGQVGPRQLIMRPQEIVC